MKPKVDLTEESLKLFEKLADDAPNWNGSPLLGGNFNFTKEMRGNLSDLKKKDLVITEIDGGESWVYFTDKGKKLVKELYGFEIKDYKDYL